MSKKIAMIGAGSIVFCKTLISDIMSTPALAASEFALMDPAENKLHAMEAFGKRMIADNGLAGSVWATTDRREAIRNADFVVIMIQVGGVRAFELDYKIPLKYGVDQCIGDSLGPGGIFRGLRSIPVLAEITRDMEELARPGGRRAAIRRPHGGQLPGARESEPYLVHRLVPRGADHARPDFLLLQRAERRDRLHVRRH